MTNIKTRLISRLTDRVVTELNRRQTEQMRQLAAFNSVRCTHGALGVMTTDGLMVSHDGGTTWRAPD